jgi:hypothetical protein
MTTDILSSNAFKVVALAIFAILVLIVCGFLLTMNRDTGRRPARDVRRVEENHRQAPDDNR